MGRYSVFAVNYEISHVSLYFSSICKSNSIHEHVPVFNLLHTKLSYLNFHPLEVVFRYRETKLQVGDSDTY